MAAQSYKYKKRITSLFGVLLPPRKKKIYPGYLVLSFLLENTLPSKKNQWVPANNFRQLKNKADLTKTPAEILEWIDENLKTYIRPNNNYIAFEARAKEILVEQARYYQKKYIKYGLSFPIQNSTSSIYFYWADNKGRDSTNKAETIHDILVDAGIIANDTWQKLTPIHLDGEDYHGEIHNNLICIDVTIKFDKSLKELEEIHKNNQQNITDITPKVKNIKRRKKSIFGIENPDLITMGWYGYTYNEEDDGETAIDLTPEPSTWTLPQKEALRRLGYDILILSEYYNKKYSG